MCIKYLLSFLCFIVVVSVKAQSVTNNNSAAQMNASIFKYVEVMPKADYDLGAYLSEHLHYPDSAKTHNIEGRVIIKFVVNEDGKISDCQLMRGIGGGCDEEALKVVAGLPAWAPGVQDGKNVKVYFTLPIVFRLK